MAVDEPRLGIHLAHGTGMVRAAKRAAELELSAVQVFGDNPTAWRRRAEPSPELPAFRSALAAAGVELIAIHASYLINPAGAESIHHERAIDLLGSELEAAEGFGASIVNVHIGSHLGAGVPAGVESVVDVVVRARALAVEHGVERLPLVALENSAGGGFGLGTDVDELAAIAEALDRAGLDRSAAAFCLDAAHAWGAGIDMGDPATIDRLLEAFDRRIGLNRLALVHLNDSSTGRGSRSDRHQHVGAGQIGPVGLGHLVRHPRLRNVPFILETPGMEDGYDAVNVARVRALLRGEALDELPREALELPGSRTRAAAASPARRGSRAAAEPVGTRRA